MLPLFCHCGGLSQAVVLLSATGMPSECDIQLQTESKFQFYLQLVMFGPASHPLLRSTLHVLRNRRPELNSRNSEVTASVHCNQEKFLTSTSPGLTARTCQIITEAGLEVGVNTNPADDNIFFGGAPSTLDNDLGLWDNETGDGGYDEAVDPNTASAMHQFVHLTHSICFYSFRFIRMNSKHPYPRKDQRTR